MYSNSFNLLDLIVWDLTVISVLLQMFDIIFFFKWMAKKQNLGVFPFRYNQCLVRKAEYKADFPSSLFEPTYQVSSLSCLHCRIINHQQFQRMLKLKYFWRIMVVMDIAMYSTLWNGALLWDLIFIKL